MNQQSERSKLRLDGPSENWPASYWVMVTNTDGEGQNWIVLPQAGNLWIYYEWAQEPAAQIYVWHQGGSTTPINEGENNIPVGQGDAIVYQLANTGDSIKFGFQVT